ncbi:MAG: hypothetical protein RJA70_4359 [Pseudomonadota bacterium]|jgi:RHS repeat-associated protein
MTWHLASTFPALRAERLSAARPPLPAWTERRPAPARTVHDTRRTTSGRLSLTRPPGATRRLPAKQAARSLPAVTTQFSPQPQPAPVGTVHGTRRTTSQILAFPRPRVAPPGRRPGRGGSSGLCPLDGGTPTGKEDDIEVGLTYFGARYYAPHLGTWCSADPVTIHELGSDMNPYSYVGGRVTTAVDPNGELAFLAVVAIAAVASFAINVATQATQGGGFAGVDWGAALIAGGAGAAGAAVGGPLGTWVGGQVASGLLGAGISAATSQAVGTGIGIAAGSAAGSTTAYVTGQGGNNLAGTKQSGSITWGGVGVAAGLGAVSGPIAHYTGGAIGSSALGQRVTSSLTSTLGQNTGQAFATGLFAGAGAGLSVSTLAAVSGQQITAENLLIASGAAAASVGASSYFRATNTNQSRLPTTESQNAKPASAQQSNANYRLVRQPDPSGNADGESAETTTEIKTRPTKGADGGTSEHIIERDASGRVISKTHRVTTGGRVVHQHQDHQGKHGGERRFPDDWVEHPEINAPPHVPRPARDNGITDE